MSETIVNRTPTTPHLAAEIAKLSLEHLASQTETTGVAVGPIPQTAEAQRAPQVGSAQPVAELAASVMSGFKTVSQWTRKSDFEDFKKEVIAAFKHLGLDTRKHFT